MNSPVPNNQIAPDAFTKAATETVFDELGFVMNSNGDVVPVDPRAARHFTETMRDVAEAFKRVQVPSLI